MEMHHFHSLAILFVCVFYYFLKCPSLMPSCQEFDTGLGRGQVSLSFTFQNLSLLNSILSNLSNNFEGA